MRLDKGPDACTKVLSQALCAATTGAVMHPFAAFCTGLCVAAFAAFVSFDLSCCFFVVVALLLQKNRSRIHILTFSKAAETLDGAVHALRNNLRLLLPIQQKLIPLPLQRCSKNSSSLAAKLSSLPILQHILMQLRDR